MSQIENQITSLLQMKSSLQDDIHKQFNLLISNENKIISMTNQTDNMQTELRRLQNETKILLNNDKVNYINNISLFKNESTNITNMKDVKNKMLLQLQDKMNNNLHSKTELDMKIHNVNVTINKLNDTNEKLKREMTFALNEKNNIMKQIKDKENKIMNLKGEINDYMNDINTIIKKVGTAEQNMKTLMSIVDEYQHIKQPYESNIMKINQEKNEVESKYKEAIYDLKRISNVLKNNTKSARIVIELAEDEIFNNNNTTINNGNKIEAIISKIIS
jgi:chromosome segregation ATPase